MTKEKQTEIRFTYLAVATYMNIILYILRGDKSPFGEWGKLPLLLIGQSLEVSFTEKTVCLFSLIKV